MKKFNLLKDYNQSKIKRISNSKTRTIKERIISSYRDKNLYDGERRYGYGGFFYDGRWKKIAQKICKKYNLNNSSKILQLGCEKGFLLNDIKSIYPKIKIKGIDMSEYAIKNSMLSVKKNLKVGNYIDLNFKDSEFDFVLALGVVYSLNLADAIKCLKEIIRVSKGNSFINLSSYTNSNDYWLFKNWTLLGSTLLTEKEWLEVLKHVKYKGNYYFTNSKTLNLKKK
jgi:ubiquinone/menaquinone biosynthesis C-methylase UbiE